MTSPQPQESSASSEDSLDTREPSLDDIVEIFLASKRSLSSINQVFRAREIVDAGRDAVEENAVLAARNCFVRYAVSVQMESIQAIRLGARAVESDGHDEMRETVNSLDQAANRLNDTLDALRDISVDSAFRPADEAPRSLFDFIDESGVDKLYVAVKESMDRFDAARTSLMDTCKAFDHDLKMIRQALDPEDDEPQQYNLDDPSPVPSFFASLEGSATDVASNLEGLVKHYDLCVSALKHTEGGGEAILKFSQAEASQEESKLAGFGLGITRLDDGTAPKPMSIEEHKTMLQVLVKDAGEVDEVVVEINDRVSEMEENLGNIQAYLVMLRTASSRLGHGLKLLKRISEDVPSYITACAEFQAAWEEEKELMAIKLEEMEQGHEFYLGFASGYDNMILEVQRRRQMRREMDKIAKNAMAQIEKLCKVDVEARQEFRAEQGEHLPSDIWPGLSDAPSRYEIRLIDDETSELPQLKKEVVEKALKRLEARGV